MSTPRPSGVLFDLDGVLLRSEEVWYQLVQEAGRRYRGTPVTRKEFGPTFGQGTAADVVGFRFTCTPAQLDRFYAENFHRYAGDVWIDPEAKSVLKAVAKAGLRRAVVTNTTTPLAKSLLQQADLHELVEVLSCADQVEKAKPAPDVVHHALRALGLQPGEAWMVGDSRFDRMAAVAAGVRFIGLRIDGDDRIDTLSGLLPLVGA